jgi:hypothetical protein
VLASAGNDTIVGGDDLGTTDRIVLSGASAVLNWGAVSGIEGDRRNGRYGYRRSHPGNDDRGHHQSDRHLSAGYQCDRRRLGQ